MKIQLVYPPQEVSMTYYPPLGLLYVAEELRRRGNSVTVSHRVGSGYDGVGVTALTHYAKWSINQLKMAKESGAHTVIGGAHTSGIGGKLLTKYPFIDTVVDGHGERVAQAAFEASGLIEDHGPYIPSFYPARDLVDMEDYITRLKPQYGGRRMTSIMAGRGCVGKCNFCTTPARFPKIAYRTPQSVVDEIIMLREKYGVNGVMFFDDALNWSSKWALSLCEELISRGPNNNLYQALARGDRMTPELANAMKLAGFHWLQFGIESASPKMLKAMNKGETIDQIRAGMDAAYKAGIGVGGCFMFGVPGETSEDRRLSVEYARNNKMLTASAYDVLFLFPGTKWAEKYGRNPLELELYRHRDMAGATEAMNQICTARLIRHPYQWYRGLHKQGMSRYQAAKTTALSVYAHLFLHEGIEQLKKES